MSRTVVQSGYWTVGAWNMSGIPGLWNGKVSGIVKPKSLRVGNHRKNDGKPK